MLSGGIYLGFLKKYTSRYRKPFSAAVLILLLEAVCDLLQPTIMARIIDIGVKNRDMDYVLRMGLLMLLVTAVGASAAIIRNILSSNVSQKFGVELRSDLYKKIQSFSFENIDHIETASLVTRLTNDVTQVQGFVHGLMRVFVKAPLLCIGSIVMASLLDARLALVLLVVIPFIGILIYISARVSYPFFISVQRMLDRVNSVMREYLSGVRVVKAFNRFAYETMRFKTANHQLSTTSMKAMRVMAVFTPGMSLVVNLGIISILWLGGIRVHNGNMQVGQIMAFINYMTQILFSLMMISFVFNMFIRAKASAERIGEVMSQENTIHITDQPIDATAMKGDIAFKNVSFSYAGAAGKPVLENIDFSCQAGETVGIIGSTGAGKSSLVHLIPRFYDACTGVVKVGGNDVRVIDPIALRDKIAIVLQKNTLFTGTIADNIKWGKDDATEEEIWEAAAAAQAHEFITSFKDGYSTLLGQGGVNLSGGQKQRIAIARALIKKPEILILDDSTSAVDSSTEENIREGLKQYAENLTCIIIAQRIISVINANKIVVMDNGRMAGIGTHQHLMLHCDVYKEIYRSQIGREGMAV